MMQRRHFTGTLGLLLGGCASPQMPGYQSGYQGHQVPEHLIERIRLKLREHGLPEASVARDMVGRVQLLGRYRDEDEVERAFLIVQSIVGLKSCSPQYPSEVRQRHWEREAVQAMAEHARRLTQARRQAQDSGSRKLALVVGINEFMDSAHLRPIQGEDDARLVATQLGRAGYEVSALLGAQANKAAIEAALLRMGERLGPADSLFLYISSHGNPPLPSPKGQGQHRMSIAAYDSGDVGGRPSRDATEYLLKLQASSVHDRLVQRLARQASRVTRVLVDTCYSGDMLTDMDADSRAQMLRANGGRVDVEGVSLAAWSADAPPSGYAFITATSEGQESLGPPVRPGLFASPLDPQRALRGSFFTQAFFDYLAHYQGLIQPAFEAAQRFTAAQALAVSAGSRQQLPRLFSTLAADDNNLYR
ncbi:caspase family protein [Paucibacter soli]|uniref:caspase family protein n=1 Tax=Paucibacter soli TaxID=3133433 RepID=UPI0030AF7F10